MELEGFPSNFTGEIYLLILDFLERSPCSESALQLKKELAQNGLVPPRYDWRGSPHPRSFEDFSKEYSILAPNPLLRLFKSLSEEPLHGKGLKVPSLLLNAKLRTVEGRSRPSRSLTHHIFQKELGFSPSKESIFSEITPSLKCLRRTLGHLSSVYCLLFDRTGSLIFTGADDLLVKCWNHSSGRLIYTFRGASSEISDLAVSHDNRLLAAGSCDKMVRVWCLFSAAPIAILSKQQGLITAVHFCPLQNEKKRYLACTSGEGAVTFWKFSYNEFGKAEFEESPTRYLEKIRPGGARMICASFSPGGIFYCVGSVDHHVRVYKMDHLDGPQRILEDNAHSDRVDSIQWCHGPGLKFLSGSKDGTARIWSYGQLKWTSITLNMTDENVERNTSNTNASTESSQDPGFASGAASTKKVTMVAWSIDDSIAITAISDNSIRLWNSKSGDYLGSLLGHSDEIYVMEPHPLCSNILLSAAHDGCIMMWSLKFQKCLMKYNNVIPSEENAALYDAKWTPDGTSVACTDSLGHLLIFGFGSSEHYSKLPKELFFHTDYRPLLRDSFNNVVDEQTQVPPHLLSSPFLVDSEGFPYQPQIQRFVRGREFLSDGEALIPRGPEPSFNINNSLQVPIPDAVSPEAPNVNGEVNLLEEAQAGARAAIHENNLVTDYELPGNVQENKSFNRYILNKNDTKYKGFIDNSLETIKEYSKLESELFLKDREKYLKDHDYLSPACINSKKTNHGLTRKTKTSSQARSRGASVEKLEEDSDEENDEVNDQTSDCSLDESDFSSIEETTYDEASSCNDHSDWGSDNDNTTNIAQSSSTDKKRSPKKNGGRNAAQKCREQIFLSTPRGELAEEYIPSQWLSESIPRKTPYFPQIGDVLMYFKRGHEKYLDLVRDRKTYIINMKEQTWIKKKLCESVMTKVIGIKFEIKPPRLAVLKFQILNLNSGNPTGETFTLKYHDMNDVVDFLVLYQTYSASTNEWKCSDRIRCQIDDCWWKGTVKSIGPETSTSITSSCDECKFLSILCHWDNAEKEFLSPWDLEKLTEDTQDIPDGTLVTPEQLKSCLYKPTVEEWNDIGRDIETKRISAALETIMGLSIAEPFNYPVDQSIYPEYFYSVEYPMDLNLIKARVDNNFYRRIASIEYDLKYIFENAEAFNVPKSDIVKNAKILVRLAGEIINDPGKNKDNVSEIYHNLVQNFLWSSSDEDAVEENPRVKKLLTKNSSESLNPKKWKQDCDDLLTKTLDQPFSGPFRGPVSEIEFPDYHRFIVTPMDLSSVRESLMIGNFNSPVDFQKDIHLMISNSRVFNTNPKSKILIMTNQLEKWIEPKIADLISNWKKTNRRLTLARRKHKIKKEGLRGQSEQQSSSHDQTPSPRGKGKGVGKGKSNNLLKKNNIKPNYEVNDESFSSSSNDDESFSPKKSSSFRRKHTLKKSEDEDYAPLSTWQLRKKRLNTTVESCESDSSSTGSVVGKESKPKPQRTAKPITKLPSSSSSSENDNIPKPSTSSSSSIKTSAGSSSSSALLGEPSKIEDESKSSIVTQVSRSGRLVRKYAWKDYTYSDNDDDDDEEQVESDDDDDAPLVRSKRVKVNNSSSPEKKPRNNPNNSSSSNLSSKTRPLRKVTKVPNVHSDEAAEDGDENFVPVSQCKKTPNAVRSFAASSVKRKKQSEESESEFSESEEDEEESDNNQQTNFVESNSEDYLSDENINQHAPPLSRQHQRDLERKKNKPKSQYQNSRDFSDVNERMLVDDEVTKRKRKSVKPAKLNEGELEEDEDVAEDDDEDDDDDEEYNVDDEDDEDYLEENSNRLNQRNGFRNHKPKSNITNSIKKRTATHQRKKRRLSSNSSEQENRRPLRRAAASQKKLTEHTSSSSSNDVTSEDECTLAERRRKKPRVM